MTMDGIWRPMREADLPVVSVISDAVHGRFTESAEVYAERLALYPAGCCLFDRDTVALGYLISHPWRRRSPVPLDAAVGAIPADADSYYLHDLALLPAARGTGAGRAAVELVFARARRGGYHEVSLVAVGGADGFWAGQGFAGVDDAAVADKLRGYGDGVFFMEHGLDLYPNTSTTGR